MSHIFISYSRSDINFAGKIVQALADNKLDTWIDWKNIPKGEDWEQEIYRGIEEADAFLFLISPDSVASQMCNKEIAHAVKNGKRILPIVIRDADLQSIHSEISKRNWIFCRYKKEPPDIFVVLDNFNDAIEETRKTIHTDYEWLKYHTELQVKALKWEQKKDASRLLRGKELRESEKQLAEIGSQEDPQPTKLQREYILVSQRNEETQRRQITIGVSVGFIVMTILAIFAWQQRNLAVSETNAKATALVNEESARNTAIAETNTRATAQAQAEVQRNLAISGKLAIQSNNLVSTNPELAMLLAAQSYQEAPSVDAERSLLTSILQNRRLIQFLPVKSISTISFSSDGRFLAVADKDRNITIWSFAQDHLNLKYSLSQFDQINSLSFGTTSNTLVMGGANGYVYRWDFLDEISRPTLIFRENGEIDLVMLLTSDHVAVKLTDGKLHLWNLKNRSLEKIYDLPSGLNDSRILPDGKVLSFHRDTFGAQYSVVNMFTGETSNLEINQPYEHSPTLGFSGDGKIMATGDCNHGTGVTMPCLEGRITLWDVTNNSMISQWGWHDDWVDSLSISSDDKTIAAASGATFDHKPGVIQLWDISGNTTHLLVKALGLPMYGHTMGITNLAFSPDNKYLVSAGQDLAVWNTDRSKYYVPEVSIRNIQSNPDTSKFLLAGKAPFDEITKIRLVDIKGNNIGELIRIACLPGQTCEKKILLNGEKLEKYSDDAKFINSLGFGKNGNAWVAIRTSDSVKILDLSLPSNQFEIKPAFLDEISLIPNSDFLLSYNYGNTKIELWDLSARNKVKALDLGMDFQDGFQIVLDPSGNLFMAYNKKMVRVLDAKSGDELGLIDIPSGYEVKSVSFATEGHTIAIGLGDDHGGNPNKVTILNLEDYQPIDSFMEQVAPTMSPQGDIMATIEDLPWKNRILLWNVKNHSKINEFSAGAEDEIIKILLDTQHEFVFGLGRGKIFIWDFNSPALIGVIESSGFIESAQYDNQYLAFSGCSHIVYQIMGNCSLGEFEFIRINQNAWLQRVCETVSRNLTEAEWFQFIGSDISYHNTCPNLPIEPEVIMTPTP